MFVLLCYSLGGESMNELSKHKYSIIKITSTLIKCIEKLSLVASLLDCLLT